MQDGEEEIRMPPNSTQNLNAKLSLTQTAQERSGGTGISLTPSPIQGYSLPRTRSSAAPLSIAAATTSASSR